MTKFTRRLWRVCTAVDKRLGRNGKKIPAYSHVIDTGKSRFCVINIQTGEGEITVKFPLRIQKAQVEWAEKYKPLRPLETAQKARMVVEGDTFP